MWPMGLLYCIVVNEAYSVHPLQLHTQLLLKQMQGYGTIYSCMDIILVFIEIYYRAFMTN